MRRPPPRQRPAARQRAGVLPRGQRAAPRRPARPGVGRARLQRGRHRRTGGPGEPRARRPARAVRRRAPRRSAARWPRSAPAERRARTDRPGQYRARPRRRRRDPPGARTPRACACSARSRAGPDPRTRRSPWCVDPVDGSTNCSRHLPYWAISLCALDADGPLCALVQNGATGARYTAVRGEGAWLRRRAAHAVRPRPRSIASVVAPVGMPPRTQLGWRQFRALGSAALVAVRRRRRSPRRLRRRRRATARAVGLPRRPARVPRGRRRSSPTPRATSSRSPTPTPAGNWWRPAPPSCSARCRDAVAP